MSSINKHFILQKIIKTNDRWALLFFLIILIVGSILLYYSNLSKINTIWNIIGTVAISIAGSSLAAVFLKFLMFEKLKENEENNKRVDLMRNSLQGLSVDGVILDPQTNFDFAIQMVSRALQAGKVVTEGNMTSDEYFLESTSNNPQNFNEKLKEIIEFISNNKDKKDNLKRYYKIYKSLKVENKEGRDNGAVQNEFNIRIAEWRTKKIKIGEYSKLCTDFLLVSDIKFQPEEALVGVFFDDDYTNDYTGQAYGWLALHITSGKTLEKVHYLADAYRKKAFPNMK